MNVLMTLLLILEIVVCFLLLVVILVQRSKSQGAGLAFGGGMGETMFGSQVGNVLTKATVILGIIFLINTTFLAYLTPKLQPRSATDLVPAAGVSETQAPAAPGVETTSALPSAPGETSFDATGITPPDDGSLPGSVSEPLAVEIPAPAVPAQAETPVQSEPPAETP